MSVNDILLGLSGSEVLLPQYGRTYSEDREEIARKERTASGRLVKDIITTKIKFKIAYSLTSHADLNMLLGIYALDTTLSLKVVKPTGTSSYTVLMSPFNQKRLKATSGGLWSDVEFELEEV